MKFSRPHSMISGHRPVDTVMHDALGFWSSSPAITLSMSLEGSISRSVEENLMKLKLSVERFACAFYICCEGVVPGCQHAGGPVV